jgi:hypothetical protein
MGDDACEEKKPPITGLRAGLDSRQGQNLSLPHVVQTGYGAHPASYPVCTGSSFPGLRRPVKITTDLCLGLRPRMMELYLHFPIHIRGAVRVNN